MCWLRKLEDLLLIFVMLLLTLRIATRMHRMWE
jgi:hypothetical protein